MKSRTVFASLAVAAALFTAGCAAAANPAASGSAPSSGASPSASAALQQNTAIPSASAAPVLPSENAGQASSDSNTALGPDLLPVDFPRGIPLISKMTPDGVSKGNSQKLKGGGWLIYLDNPISDGTGDEREAKAKAMVDNQLRAAGFTRHPDGNYSNGKHVVDLYFDWGSVVYGVDMPADMPDVG